MREGRCELPTPSRIPHDVPHRDKNTGKRGPVFVRVISAFRRAIMAKNPESVRNRNPSGDCVKCGTWVPMLELDHIRPLYKGGEHDTNNLQWLCPSCHKYKTSHERTNPAKGRMTHFQKTMRILDKQKSARLTGT